MAIALADALAYAASLAIPAGTSFAVSTVITESVFWATIAVEAVGVGVGVAEALKTPPPAGMRLTIREPIPPRRRGVGTMRAGGPFLLDEAPGATNDLFRICAVIDGPVANIARYYLSQDRAVLVGDTNVAARMPNGGYSDSCLSIYTQFGASGVPSFTAYAGRCSWSDSDTGTGIFMAAYKGYGGSLQNFSACYPRGVPELNIVGDLGVAYDWRDDTQSQTDPSTWKHTANPIVGLAHELWCYRGYDWTLDFLPALDILTAEADYCDQATAVLNVFTQAITYSTAGQSFVVLDADGPIPANGTTIYVGSQSPTVTGNGGMVSIGDYGGIKIELSAPLLAGVPPQFPIRWQATPDSPASEPTYSCHGLWNTDEPEKDTVKKFIDSMDGWMQRRGSDGAVILRCGHYYEPTVNIGADEVIDYTWDDYPSDGKVINYLIPAVVHPAWDYTQVDTANVSDETSIEAYGESNQPFKPDFVTSNGQVMRLAYRRLAKLLCPINSVTLKRSGIRVLGERFINISFGADLPAVTVEICGTAKITQQGMAVRLPVRLVDPATIDAYDAYTMEGNGPAATAPAPGPGGLGYDAPTIANVSSFTDTETEDGAPITGERLAVSVSPPAAFAARTDLTWWLQWMVVGGNSWNPVGPVTGLAAGNVVIDTGFVPSGSNIVVQAAYQAGGGQWSPWSASASPTRALLTPGGQNIELPGGAGHVILP